MEQHLRSTHLSPCLYVHSAMPNVMLLVWICCCLLLSFPFLQANTEYSLLCQNSLFMFHSLLSSLSLMDSLTLVSSVSLSLLCLLSPTHPCSSIYTSWSTENGSVFSPCCREPMQHTVTQSTDYLLIQSHANTITHN